MADGCYGPIVIHPSSDQATPFCMISNSSADLEAIDAAAANPIPVSITDWFQQPFQAFYKQELAAGVDDYCPDAVLVNGKVGRPPLQGITKRH